MLNFLELIVNANDEMKIITPKISDLETKNPIPSSDNISYSNQLKYFPFIEITIHCLVTKLLLSLYANNSVVSSLSGAFLMQRKEARYEPNLNRLKSLSQIVN